MSDWAGLSLESAHWCLTELCTELILKSERAQQTETCQNGHVSVGVSCILGGSRYKSLFRNIQYSPSPCPRGL